MNNDFQSEVPRFARTPVRHLDEAPDPFGRSRTGLRAWGWLVIVVAVLFLLCGGVGVVGAVGWLLYQDRHVPTVEPEPPRMPAEPPGKP